MYHKNQIWIDVQAYHISKVEYFNLKSDIYNAR